MTTAPAPTMARSYRHIGKDRRTRSYGRAFLDEGGLDFPVRCRLQFTVLRSRAGIRIVDEHDTVTDEDRVLDRDALTDERVARDFAPLSRLRSSESRQKRRSSFRPQSRNHTG